MRDGKNVRYIPECGEFIEEEPECQMTSNEAKRGRWFFRSKRRTKADPYYAHLMSDETKTFCGHRLVTCKPADVLGPWDPEDHLDVVCPQCLEWWRNLTVKASMCASKCPDTPS